MRLKASLYSLLAKMITTGFNPPEPNPAKEAKVRPRLKELDSLLDIRWIPTVYFNKKYRAFEGRYALICTWPQSDPRWKEFYAGRIEEPFDILGWFAVDMQDAEMPLEPDLIWDKVLELLSKADNQKTPWKLRMKQAAEKNARMKRQRKDDFLNNEVHDIASYERARAVGAVTVNVPKEIK